MCAFLAAVFALKTRFTPSSSIKPCEFAPNFILPITSNFSAGLPVPIPTRLLVASTDKVKESISKSVPVIPPVVILPVVTIF